MNAHPVRKQTITGADAEVNEWREKKEKEVGKRQTPTNADKLPICAWGLEQASAKMEREIGELPCFL